MTKSQALGQRLAHIDLARHSGRTPVGGLGVIRHPDLSRMTRQAWTGLYRRARINARNLYVPSGPFDYLRSVAAAVVATRNNPPQVVAQIGGRKVPIGGQFDAVRYS